MPENTKDSEQAAPVISVRDLRVQYGDREILHGLTFDVKRAETLLGLRETVGLEESIRRTAAWYSA